MSLLVSGNTDAPLVVTNEEATVLTLLNSLFAYQLRNLLTLRPQNVVRIRSRAVLGIHGKCSVTQGPNTPRDTSVTIKGEKPWKK